MGRPARAGFQHPLMGARLEVLLRLLISQRGVSARHLPLVAGMLASAIARTPFRVLDAFEARRRRPIEEVNPLFIVGHWRSGTTHLHNLLSRSPHFGIIRPLAAGIPDEMLTLGRWLRPLLERALPSDRAVDRVAVSPDSPQEDEIPLANMGGVSIFHGLYFPRSLMRHVERGVLMDGLSDGERARWIRLERRLLTKAAIDQGTPDLLIKNVASTARVGLLREVWPRARFIFIRRSPYEVFASTRAYYRTMLAMLALQRHDRIDVDSFVLETYPRVMDRYIEDARSLATGSLAEVSYESLVADPMGELERVHRVLELPGWDVAAPRIAEYLGSLRGYQRNALRMSRADLDRVERAWGRYIDMWGYRRPDVSASEDASQCVAGSARA